MLRGYPARPDWGAPVRPVLFTEHAKRITFFALRIPEGYPPIGVLINRSCRPPTFNFVAGTPLIIVATIYQNFTYWSRAGSRGLGFEFSHLLEKFIRDSFRGRCFYSVIRAAFLTKYVSFITGRILPKGKIVMFV